MTGKESVRPPAKAAGGFGALLSSFHQLRVHGVVSDWASFLKANRPDGFDCPGCAWPEPKEASRMEFCENGVKAIAHEITSHRVDRAFFERHTVGELAQRDHYWLERQGRLTEPMRYNAETDRYEPIAWADAFQLVGDRLRALEHPDRAVFYTSGRTSNEAAFLYQLFGRLLGTNNFPDCSNMCHESSGVALGEAIGIGKGTVTIEDFEKADAIFIFGQNPGTNHPRMLAELQKAAQRGCTIVSFNPLKEPGLQRFTHPKHPVATLVGSSTPISSHYYQPLVGGDLAAVKGMIKVVLEREAAAPGTVLDQAFIETHTRGFEAVRADAMATAWEDIEANSGLTRAQVTEAAELYLAADRVIACWAMGLTQQKQAVGSIQTLVNLLLLRGNMGKPGAGACPVRGHSNVQGDRTVGIVEKPKPEFLDALGRVFDFDPPREHGLNTVEAIKAMDEGRVDVLFCMGGNFAAATPDTELTEAAIKRLDLTVHVSTKLNRSHVVTGKDALILPCLGRTERDEQAEGPQVVTVEDSMSMVHASRGHRRPAGAMLLSEPAIVAGVAKASLTHEGIDWDALVADYDRIRAKIAEVLPMFADYNRKIREPGGFYLGNSARDRVWRTQGGQARFSVHPLPENHLEPNQLRLMTVRSHDQFNTTIYGLDDRYRGIKGKRMVVFLNGEDMADRALEAGMRVDLISQGADGRKRKAEGFEVVPYELPRGCAAAYFPETNVLVPIDSYASRSFTPASKFIPVWLERCDV
ncbi:FdhF/YdeP family oxidoreductase [Sulfidibacter corallicola]|uniref:FdhF/YdeP family oxidoreductase n=1 Tax=Sulfidibacter corallicola TaxID=2818388 RepID=A0A8A4TQJ0_SULCO|nr:FdhF/YdeP family oxidoreductase [Sulfidibacter corallicola]QTD51687.1 FdhF/YdeP family oxidoreductase [Sulfidibacter corallicola]